MTQIHRTEDPYRPSTEIVILALAIRDLLQPLCPGKIPEIFRLHRSLSRVKFGARLGYPHRLWTVRGETG